MLDDWQDACKIGQHWKMHKTCDRLNRHWLEKRTERIEREGETLRSGRLPAALTQCLLGKLL